MSFKAETCCECGVKLTQEEIDDFGTVQDVAKGIIVGAGDCQSTRLIVLNVWRLEMTKKQIQSKYDCIVYMDYIDGFRFYQAYPKDKNNCTFESASGWNLKELIDSIENNQLKEEIQ